MKHESLENLLLNNELKIIFRYLIKLGASREDAEDILQDALCRTIEYIDVIDEKGLKAWLFKVSINKYYNLYNKKKHYMQIEIDEEAIQGFLSEDDTLKSALDREKRAQVYKTLNDIGDNFKNLILMKYSLNMSYREIADYMDVSEDSVKTYLFRARNRFKKLWEESGYER